VSIEEFPYPNAGTGNSAVISSQQLNSLSATATIVLSGFSYTYIRDVTTGFPPARVQHLRHILLKLGNIIALPSAIDPGDGPQLANYLDGNYPNPFNPTTTIRFGVKTQGHVTLKVYNVAGQLVKTLVDEIRVPAEEYKARWNGDTDSGVQAATGVYFYKLVMKDFAQTKKMVLLK